MIPTSQQLRVALEIIEAQEAGDPVEWEVYNGEAWVHGSFYNIPPNPITCLIRKCEIRIKPFAITNSINGHTLGPGQEWHRTDGWARDDLPPGTRPHLLGEVNGNGDEWLDGSRWVLANLSQTQPTSERSPLYRTTRPLPVPPILVPEGWRELDESEKDGTWQVGAKVWHVVDNAWISFNGSNPERQGAHKDKSRRIIVPITPESDPYAELKAAYARGAVIQTNGYGDWADLKDGKDMILVPLANLRIKPSPVMIPLGTADVPMMSFARHPFWEQDEWSIVGAVNKAGICILQPTGYRPLSFDFLYSEGWFIHRPSAPGVWSKCEKPQPN